MKCNYQLAEEVGDATIGDIGDQSEKEECPCHWIHQSLLDLVKLEMLVTDSLLVDANPGNGENTIFLL